MRPRARKSRAPKPKRSFRPTTSCGSDRIAVRRDRAGTAAQTAAARHRTGVNAGRIAAAALAALALATGCVRQAPTASSSGNSWTIPGVLRLGEDEEPDSLNPMFAHTAATDTISGLLFSFILRYDPDGNYVPDLATAVPTTHNGGISADGKTITVHLRKGVVWADGAPLTAADWLFTYHAVMNPRNNVKTRYGWDHDRIGIRARSVHARHQTQAADRRSAGHPRDGRRRLPAAARASAGEAAELNTAEFNSKPLSSGPYLLKAWNHGSSLEFVPNPRYFRGAPKLKEVDLESHSRREHALQPTANARRRRLPGRQRQRRRALELDLRASPSIKRLIANWRHLGINMSRPLLADVRVRQAIAEGVDWKRINDTIYHGINRLAVSDIFPQSWAAPALPPYRYDPQHARAAARGAGWAMGSDGVLHKGPLAMHLTISATTGHIENDQSEVLIQSIAASAWASTCRSATIRPRCSSRRTARSTAANTISSGRSKPTAPIPTTRDAGTARSFRRTARIRRGSTIRSSTETSAAAAATFDQGKRKALYQREEERIRELVPAVFFTWETGYTAINTDVKNYVPAAFIGDTWNAWAWRSERLVRASARRRGTGDAVLRAGARRRAQLEYVRRERNESRSGCCARTRRRRRGWIYARVASERVEIVQPDARRYARRRRRDRIRPAVRRHRGTRARRGLQSPRVRDDRALHALASLRAQCVHPRRARTFAIHHRRERGWCSPAASRCSTPITASTSRRRDGARRLRPRLQRHRQLGFNVAYSGSLGLRGVVAYLRNFDHAQRLIERNIPIAISYSWRDGRTARRAARALRRPSRRAPRLRRERRLRDQRSGGARRSRRLSAPALETIWQRNGGVAYVVAPAGIDYADILAS